MRLRILLTPYASKQSNPAPKPVLLENIRVAAPCPASWERMSGDDRVRHCAECNLNVYNLSDLTRREAESLIASHEGRLCVRYYRRADGTILTRNCPPGLQAMVHRVSRIAGAALSAVMSLGYAFAQTGQQTPPETKKEQAAQPQSQLTFTVVDQAGAVIAGAQFRLTNEQTGVAFMGVTNSNGAGIVSALAPGSFVLKIEHQGFKPFLKVITIKQNKPETLRVALQVNDAQVVVGILIQGDVPRVETESYSLQTTISGDFLRSLPMR